MISGASVAAVVVVQSPLYVHWMGVVTFYQVAVVAIHRSDQIREHPDSFGWHAALETL